jgi:diaminobutyrate-2-oxoglutarate transaminase
MDDSIKSLESEVRYYSRLFPAIFSRASGSYVFCDDGSKYLDFFCGSGSLNYGHNNPVMKQSIIDYLQEDGIINSLDQMTEAKLNFMKNFHEIILKPRDYNYKFQFCGPTGTNSVEAAMKLARKFTGREKIIFFEHSFHGMTYGSMSVSGMQAGKLSKDYTKNSVEISFSENENSIADLKEYLKNCSAEDLPGAIILETIQAEGGMKVGSKEWIESVATIAKKFDILLIIDDIQTGCGRTGTFFSFENMNIRPDIICLSKSLSGYGFPFSINLINPDIDCWNPGEHNGTFRGNNLAFISATRALDYWKTDALSKNIMRCSALVKDYFFSALDLKGLKLRGRGLMFGIESGNEEQNMRLQKTLFKNGILMDTCGYKNNVLKIMPPITISDEDLMNGLDIIHKSVIECSTGEEIIFSNFKLCPNV